MSVDEQPQRSVRPEFAERPPRRTLTARAAPPTPPAPLQVHPAFAPELDLSALSRGAARLADGRWLLSSGSAAGRRLLRDIAPVLVTMAEPAAFEAALRRALAGSVADEISMGLERRHPGASARTGASARQRRGARALLAAVVGGALLSADLTVFAVALCTTTLFTLHLIWSVSALIEHGTRAAEPPPEPLPDHALPSYGVIVPLRGEEAVLRALLQRLDRLDYPRDRLEVRLAIDADDPSMLRAAGAVRLPPSFAIVVVPPGRPATKPRALNAALLGLATEHVVVFDAEDEPDPLQLRKAAALFARSPREVACLQARLCIANTADTLVSALFTLEYAGLFDVVKPALASQGFPVPLGGTSNHFRGLR